MMMNPSIIARNNRLLLLGRIALRTNRRKNASLLFSTLTAADVQLRIAEPQGVPSPALRRLIRENEQARNELAYCLSFSSDESDFARNFAQLDTRMKEQLRNCERQQQQQQQRQHSSSSTIDQDPLPRSLEDALRPNKGRAIVITEATKPFRVVNVNSTWEALCGYSYLESKGKTLGSLLQGPETDATAATNLIVKLLQGYDEAGTTLTNYTKSGRRFRNRIRVGPLHDSSAVEEDDESNAADHTTHFVGVLQEVQDGM